MWVHDGFVSATATKLPHHRWETYVTLSDDDKRELVDGVLVEVDMPTEQHEHTVGLLVYFLNAWARPRKAGRVLPSGYKIRISDDRAVMPDVQFYRTENLGVLSQQGLTQGHPDLVIEVVSDISKRYDRVVKLGWYASIGVPEYWLVDSAAQTLERLVLHDGRYLIADALSVDATFRPETFTGLEIPLAELFAPATS